MGRNSHLQSCGDVGVQSEDDTERTAFGPDFTELYKPAIKYGIKWQNMPVEIGDFFFFCFFLAATPHDISHSGEML